MFAGSGWGKMCQRGQVSSCIQASYSSEVVRISTRTLMFLQSICKIQSRALPQSHKVRLPHSISGIK
jgi:hypothetical protein